MQEQQIPIRIAQRYQAWWQIARNWNRGHYAIGSAAILTAAISPLVDNKWAAGALAVTSAICTGYVTFLSPKTRADLFFRAWRHLDRAIRRYELGLGSLDELNAAVDDGEMSFESAGRDTTPQTSKTQPTDAPASDSKSKS